MANVNHGLVKKADNSGNAPVLKDIAKELPEMDRTPMKKPELKELISLAVNSGKYKTVNVTEVYEGDIKKLNRLTGELELHEDNQNQDKLIGYAAYFKLLNGFEKSIYIKKETSGSSVLMQLLDSYGGLGAEIQTIMKSEENIL